MSAQVPDRKNPIVINIVPKARKSTKFLIFGAKISVEFSGALGLYFILILPLFTSIVKHIEVFISVYFVLIGNIIINMAI